MFFFLMFSSPFPPSLPAFLFFSLTLSTWCPRQNSVGIPNEDYKSGSNGFLELCVRVCLCVFMHVCVAMCVCVCVSLVCGTKMSQCVPRQTFGCVPLAIEDYKPSLCLFTLVHSASLPLANDPVRHIHSFKQTPDLGSSLKFPLHQAFKLQGVITKKLGKTSLDSCSPPPLLLIGFTKDNRQQRAIDFTEQSQILIYSKLFRNL